jgi:phosphoribosyl-ATP pyrophosphohydrolase
MTDLANLAVLARLAATIAARDGADPTASWTAKLLADPTLAARKLGEEALETVIASMQDDSAALTSEAADLVYHLLALLAAKGVALDDVLAELARREGRSGLDEKAARDGNP